MSEDETAPADYRRAVGIMLLNPEGMVLVAQRIGMAEDAWQMPQGGLDPGETPREAAFRELEEEIGTAAAEIVLESRGWLRYDLPPELRAVVWGGRFRGQMQKWFAMRFLGRDEDINLATAHPEFSAWKWVPLDDLPVLIVPFKRRLYEDILAEFAPRLGRPGR